MNVDGPTEAEYERTAGRTWFVGGVFVGLGVAPVVGALFYGVASVFFDPWLSDLVVLSLAVLSFAVGLAYVALARTLEG